MADIPEDQVTIKDLYVWYEKKQQLAKLKNEESLLRGRVMKHFFPAPKEGTNKYDIGEGYELKCAYSFARKVDPVMLNTLKAMKVRECLELLVGLGYKDAYTWNQELTVFEAVGISEDKLLRYKPELETRAYRTLTAEQTRIFNQCLEIKPESPQLTIEPTAEKKKQLEAAAAPKAP